MANEVKRNYTPGAIAGIALLAFGFIAWAISEYRPTAEGQRAWEWISGISFAGFVGLVIYAFVSTKRR